MDKDDPRTKHWFQKGNKLAAGQGRPKIPDDIRRIRGLEQSQLIETVHEMLKLTKDEFKELMGSSTITMRQMTVGAVLTKIASKGDAFSLNMILDRLIGKSKEHVDFDFGNEEVTEGDMPSGLTPEAEAELRKKKPEYLDQKSIQIGKMYGKESVMRVLSNPKSRARVLESVENLFSVYGMGLANKMEQEKAERERMAAEAAREAEHIVSGLGVSGGIVVSGTYQPNIDEEALPEKVLQTDLPPDSNMEPPPQGGEPSQT